MGTFGLLMAHFFLSGLRLQPFFFLNIALIYKLVNPSYSNLRHVLSDGRRSLAEEFHGLLPSYLRKLCHLRFVSADDNASVAAASVIGAGVVHDKRRAAMRMPFSIACRSRSGKTRPMLSWAQETSSVPGGLSQQKSHVSQFMRAHGGQAVAPEAFSDSSSAGGHAAALVEFEGRFDGEGDD